MKFFAVLTTLALVGLASAGLLDRLNPKDNMKKISGKLVDLNDKILDKLPNFLARYYVYTRSNRNDGQQVYYNKPESIEASNFDGSKDTKVIVHGYVESVTNDPWILEAKDLFLERGDVNVIVVDYNLRNHTTYQILPNLVPKTFNVGKQIGKLIENTGSDPSKFYLVGNDIGAHVSGYAGRYLGGAVGRITGLDTIGLDWDIFPLSEDQKLHYKHAMFVDVIHTDVNHTGFELGRTEAHGHIDFYPNFGLKYQPGCETERKQNVHKFVACNNHRAREFFMETLRSDDIPTPRGYICPDYESFMAGQCTECGASGEKCAVMGLRAGEYYDAHHPTGMVGRFFLNTGATPPYFEYQYVASVELSSASASTIQVTMPTGQTEEIQPSGQTTNYRKFFLSKEKVSDAEASFLGNGNDNQIQSVEIIPLSE